MVEAQELMEQLTLEKNAEIALKLAELEDFKKQLGARRQLLNALLDVFKGDKFSKVRRVERAYREFCNDKGIEQVCLSSVLVDFQMHACMHACVCVCACM